MKLINKHPRRQKKPKVENPRAERKRWLEALRAEKRKQWGVPNGMKVYHWTGRRNGQQSAEIAAARSKTAIMRTLKKHGLWLHVYPKEVTETGNEQDNRRAGNDPLRILWRTLDDNHRDRGNLHRAERIED